MKKISTMQVFWEQKFLESKKLTIGMDLGDRWSFYCILDEAGKIILEQKLPTTPEAMKQTFGKIPRSLIAMETGTHSPWVSRLLTEQLFGTPRSARGARTKSGIDHSRAIEKMIDTMRGHWHGSYKRESIPSCWDRCGIAVLKAHNSI